jgi:hypothetical protein
MSLNVGAVLHGRIPKANEITILHWGKTTREHDRVKQDA